MTDKIDKTLKAVASQIGKRQITEEESIVSNEGFNNLELLGDPQCPVCHGVGLVRMDLPVNHPDFGRMHICECRLQQVRRVVNERLFALSQLHELKDLTFDNFESRGRIGMYPQEAASIEMAYQQAYAFATNLNGWLFLQGGFGCGKTHLAAAVANLAVTSGVPTLFLTVPDLLDSLRFSFNDAEFGYEDRLTEIRQVPLLVLDDLGTQNTTSWAQEKLFQILNYRYINRLPLVVTTNNRLEQIEGRIRSRLEDPELVTKVIIKASDFRRPTEDMSSNEFAAFPRLQKCTFANFDLRKEEGLDGFALKTLDVAFRAARDFAERPNGWMVLSGESGCGKTHLAAAIHNYRRDIGQESRFVIVTEMLNALRDTFNTSTTETLDQRFDEIRQAKFLILDDLGGESTSPWANEKLYQLINYRYNSELPTVLTLTSRQKQQDPRLLTRIEDRRISTIYIIKAPSYTNKQAIPQRSDQGNPKKVSLRKTPYRP